MNTTSALILWGVLVLAFLLCEALTPQLLCIWFSVGALASLVAAALHAPFWLQVLLFVLVSVAMVLLMRPLSRKFKSRVELRAGADRIIGRHGIVVQTISPDRGEGQICIDGAVWSAKSVEGDVLAEGVRVKVLCIEGVRAVVRLSRVQPEATE